jgi:hypothetical protein
VLDVAYGTGNAALPVARPGARVTGVDLVPKVLEVGRAKAEADGLAIDWRVGDAENLPFEDGRFDRVLSTFGHMVSRTSSWRGFRSWPWPRPCSASGSENSGRGSSMSGRKANQSKDGRLLVPQQYLLSPVRTKNLGPSESPLELPG